MEPDGRHKRPKTKKSNRAQKPEDRASRQPFTLVELAIAAGYFESTCVRNRGLAGTKDWKLIDFVVENDYTLVTHNSVDFRGNGPGGLGGEHAKQAIHAGLICPNSAFAMDLNRQCDLFNVVLQELSTMQDLVNQALDLFECEDGSVEIEIYDIPIPS